MLVFLNKLITFITMLFIMFIKRTSTRVLAEYSSTRVQTNLLGLHSPKYVVEPTDLYTVL